MADTTTIPPVADDEAMRIASIIERVEAGTGPDRELDQAIYCAVTVAQGHRIKKLVGGDLEVWPKRDDRFFTVQPGMVLPYTASLDAAMTLVPKAWRLVGACEQQNSEFFASLFPRDPDAAGVLPTHQGFAEAVCRGHGATFALALTAAAVRAYARRVGDHA